MRETPLRILVTGEEEEGRFPTAGNDGRPLRWTALPVLQFERLPIEAALMERLVKEPFGWIVFGSSRAVHFWGETLLEHHTDFPHETQVAAIGEKTAEIAAADGFTPDFYPLEPGSEGFLAEFEEILALRAEKPSILLPAAEGGRTLLRDRLTALGCPVTSVPLYRTRPRGDLGARLAEAELAALDAIVFTSPSSVDAVLASGSLPAGVPVLALGPFTGDHLASRGIAVKAIPRGAWGRIGEVLT